MKRPVTAIILSLFAVMTIALSACNTTKGAGRDLERGGESLQRSAERHGAD